ncbi:MAG TPA: beta-ketoacyl-[acyl-carrier-protein] synthase II [Solirubrobacteraceae bacterium]|jgi:3-oxoacyl-[acyl-carrier-protein] synthase II|nr:beta-ketoacyl-[acyl-carrier-protein] synthase II [Solirubrobacteraceae bacterium]
MKREIAVTGLGAVTPLGVGARTLHERWIAGTSGIEDGEGPCSEFEPTEHLSVKEARRSDRFTQFALAASDEALKEAGWDDEAPYDPKRIGCIVGTGIGGIDTLTRNHQVLLEQGPKKVSPLSIPLMMGNAAAGAVSMRHNLRGPSFAPVSACSAGAHSIGEAMELIEYGRADAVVTGSSEAALVPLARAAFGALDAMSELGISRPFDARRDGFVMGEGAAILVLEDAEQARARGATILAYVRGYGATSDAFHLTAPDSEGAGATEAMRLALADAGLTPEDVVYVNAHGTSTPLNDRAETLAIKAALGEAAKHIPVSSTKSAIGHLLGAAGSVEAVATILALRDRIAPPTLGLEESEEGLDLDYVPGKARPLDIDGKPAVGLSNGFGFGGHNAVLCLEAA